MNTAHKTLIERWLPIRALGIESQRERGASSALPPLYFLHVWWARRPLTVSRAAVVGSLLPAWSNDWPPALLESFPSDEEYRRWFRRLMGINAEVEGAKRLLDYANARRVKLPVNPFNFPRAFTVSPSDDDMMLMRQLLQLAWGADDVVVLDPMAGGGSIPFESARFGLKTIANELNPVASVVLKATLEYPSLFSPDLAGDLETWGKACGDAIEDRIGALFPRRPGESILAYVWARTVTCPTTLKPIPLAPNWWLDRGTNRVALKPIAHQGSDRVEFEIVRENDGATHWGDEGTVRRGAAVSPWTGEIVDGDYIKREARAGRMDYQLIALAIKDRTGRTFRLPDPAEIDAARAAREQLRDRLPEWQSRGWVPTEPRKAGRADWAAEIYGLDTWADTYMPRQLFAILTCLDAIDAVVTRVRAELPAGRAAAIQTSLGLVLDKVADYNSTQAIWDPTRQKIAHAFQRHDFSFKWTFAEWDVPHNLWPWALDQVVDAYRGIDKLLGSSQQGVWRRKEAASLTVSQGNASDLSGLATGSVTLVCVDPPYYGSVHYAELSDYFYVWLKRTVADLYPTWFGSELTDKEDEAVANESRFVEFGSKRRVLAKQDYERKMAAAFREMHRVLRNDGVLTVMFTHKEVEAWDALARALIEAGFRIETSWPVHTESEHSLHQARKNAASSTILLVCRKRRERSDSVWWEDLKGRVRRVARERAAEFSAEGISGVDLYISAFGPALSVISEHWPVLTSELDEQTRQPKVLRPEIALDLAREEVISLRKEGLLLGRPVTFDPVTDWYVMAWDAFRAEEFPADEARKLAIAVGIDAMEDVLVRRERLITKKQSSVVLQQPKARRKRDIVDPDAGVYPVLIDAVHSAMLVHDEDGLPACREFLRRTGYLTDGTFRACVQALLNAIPRTRDKRGFVRPEAATLDAMRNTFFDDLVVPPEEEVELPAATQTAFAWGGEQEVGEELEESDDTEEE